MLLAVSIDLGNAACPEADADEKQGCDETEACGEEDLLSDAVVRSQSCLEVGVPEYVAKVAERWDIC